MVFDKIENAKQYYGLGKGIETVLKFYENYDAAKHETTKVVLDGEKIFVNRMAYTTAPHPDALFEAHRDYVDVMFVAAGEEKFFTKPLVDMKTVTAPFDPAIDAVLGKIDEDSAAFRFPAGCFCIFFPQDAHCASQLWEKPSDVKKMVAKVHMSTL